MTKLWLKFFLLFYIFTTIKKKLDNLNKILKMEHINSKEFPNLNYEFSCYVWFKILILILLLDHI